MAPGKNTNPHYDQSLFIATNTPTPSDYLENRGEFLAGNLMAQAIILNKVKSDKPLGFQSYILYIPHGITTLALPSPQDSCYNKMKKLTRRCSGKYTNAISNYK